VVDQALAVADLFLESGTLVTVVERGQRQRRLAHPGAFGGGLVVLIDRHTASAAELVAAALAGRRPRRKRLAPARKTVQQSPPDSMMIRSSLQPSRWPALSFRKSAIAGTSAPVWGDSLVVFGAMIHRHGNGAAASRRSRAWVPAGTAGAAAWERGTINQSAGASPVGHGDEADV